MVVADPLDSEHFLAELAGSIPAGLLASVLRCWQGPLDLAAYPTSGTPLIQLQPTPGRPLAPQIVLPADALAMRARLDPLVRVAHLAALLAPWRSGGCCLALQVHDEEPAIKAALRLDAPAGQAQPACAVIPDPYCLGSRGYWLFRQAWAASPPPPWRQRQPLAIWRGATTGSKAITPHRLNHNLRYRLCAHSLRWPQRLDARFSAVVQCRDRQAQAAVIEHLRGIGLLAASLEPLQMAQCRWILDIDGNVNSWGLLWKLLSGSCVLRVESARGQWYHHRLQPYRHLVPIRADLSDLEQQLDWCFANPASCEAIAAAGQQLALEVLEDLGVDLLTALRWSLVT